MRFRVASVVLGAILVGTAVPAAAQLRASRPPRPTQNLPRLLVANPHTFVAGDSAAAVRVGTGLRDKLEAIADKWYQIITRAQMNDALLQYGYPPDAILPPLVARQLATQLQARAIVLGTLNRGEGGRVSVESRLLARNDQTGFIVTSAQAAGQSFEDFGARAGEALKGAFTALPDAIACMDQLASLPDKAVEAANKALKSQPNHGLASMCMAQIALAKKAPVDEVLKHYKGATNGDRLSVEAWGGLLGQYQAKGDTTSIIETYKQLILVAPNNQKVVEEAVRFFVVAGQPDLGEQVAKDAIERDQANPDLQNMLATACLVQDKPEKNLCAIKAMEQVFALDTAKADTFNILKILFVAGKDSSNAASYLKWAQFGSAKFPANDAIMTELRKAYELSGPSDSVVAINRRLFALNESDLSPIIRAVRLLFKEKRFKEGLEIGTVIEQKGQENDKGNYGIILAQEAGIPILQTQPPDFLFATDVGKKALGLLKPGTRQYQLASYVVGFGLLGQLSDKDTETMNAKTCDAVNAYDAFITETKTMLTAGQSIQPEAVNQRVQAIDQSFVPRVAQMKKAYCKAQ
jgi:tetratricopeptide (TPR) repeat protein